MQIDQALLKQAAKASGISEKDLQAFFARGEKRIYEPNEWLFHESTPRQWAGIVLEGDVELVRGLHGSSRHVGTIIPGAIISEGAFLDGDAHSNGGFTRNGVTIWQISKAQIE
ncbi:MAG: cyclic nucleotide-binding domain-containing protein, partial [Desulfobulbales bacterium]